MVPPSKIIGRRFGVVDVGTNSVLCLIAEQVSSTHFDVLEDWATITRIGEGISKSHKLKKTAINRTLKAVINFIDQCRRFNVDELFVIGTSALRQAENSDVFRDALRKKRKVEIEIISGTREAELSFIAVSNEFPHLQDKFIVMDIGGGSTEFIFGSPDDLCTTDLGSVRLTEKYLKSDPPNPKEMEALNEHVREAVKNTFKLHPKAQTINRSKAH